jgi:hypothetical protein
MEYNYKELAAGEIRLIELLPGPVDSDLRCKISHYRLDIDEKPKYIALSYYWGTGGLDHVLYAPEVIPVTASLHAALCRIRREEESKIPMLVWADASSINQNDIAEVNFQVLHMYHIYEKAAVVMIYLGEQEQNSDLVLELITKYYDFYCEKKKRRSRGQFGGTNAQS